MRIGLVTIIFLITSMIFLSGCGENSVPTPKPRSFPKVDFPERSYLNFDADYCSFVFQYPGYSEILKDEYFFEEDPLDECWFDLSLTPFNGALHCSYIGLINRDHFDEMVNDAFEMVGKHNIKAQFRDEYPIEKDNVYGMLFELEGEVASNLQFYLTDSTSHFFRASLYFNSKVNSDSIAPIYDFVKSDILNMIETFEWIK